MMNTKGKLTVIDGETLMDKRLAPTAFCVDTLLPQGCGLRVPERAGRAVHARLREQPLCHDLEAKWPQAHPLPRFASLLRFAPGRAGRADEADPTVAWPQ